MMSPARDALVAYVDVDYRDPIAVAAGVWLRGPGYSCPGGAAARI
jgi:hypothetical protein